MLGLTHTSEKELNPSGMSLCQPVRWYYIINAVTSRTRQRLKFHLHLLTWSRAISTKITLKQDRSSPFLLGFVCFAYITSSYVGMETFISRQVLLQHHHLVTSRSWKPSHYFTCNKLGAAGSRARAASNERELQETPSVDATWPWSIGDFNAAVPLMNSSGGVFSGLFQRSQGSIFLRQKIEVVSIVSTKGIQASHNEFLTRGKKKKETSKC